MCVASGSALSTTRDGSGRGSPGFFSRAWDPRWRVSRQDSSALCFSPWDQQTESTFQPPKCPSPGLSVFARPFFLSLRCGPSSPPTRRRSRCSSSRCALERWRQCVRVCDARGRARVCVCVCVCVSALHRERSPPRSKRRSLLLVARRFVWRRVASSGGVSLLLAARRFSLRDRRFSSPCMASSTSAPRPRDRVWRRADRELGAAAAAAADVRRRGMRGGEEDGRDDDTRSLAEGDPLFSHSIDHAKRNVRVSFAAGDRVRSSDDVLVPAQPLSSKWPSRSRVAIALTADDTCCRVRMYLLSSLDHSRE